MAVTIDGSANTITANATLTSALSTATGSAPSYSARAWVNFNGTGTVAIRASGNVSSITDNGVGDYTVNFTSAMPDSDYAVAGTLASNSSNSSTVVIVKATTQFGTPALKTTTQCEFLLNYYVAGGLADPAQVYITFTR